MTIEIILNGAPDINDQLPFAPKAGTSAYAVFVPKNDEQRLFVAVSLSVMAILFTLAFMRAPNFLRSPQEGYLLEHLSLGSLIFVVLPVYLSWLANILIGLLAIWHWAMFALGGWRRLFGGVVFVLLWASILVNHARCPHGHFIAIGPMTFGTQGERNCNQKKQYVPIWLPTTSDGK